MFSWHPTSSFGAGGTTNMAIQSVKFILRQEFEKDTKGFTYKPVVPPGPPPDPREIWGQAPSSQ